VSCDPVREERGQVTSKRRRSSRGNWWTEFGLAGEAISARLQEISHVDGDAGIERPDAIAGL